MIILCNINVSQKKQTWACAFHSSALKKILFWISTGVYGDVHRVKIMFKKRGIALVQMADASQAQLGIDF